MVSMVGGCNVNSLLAQVSMVDVVGGYNVNSSLLPLVGAMLVSMVEMVSGCNVNVVPVYIEAT